MSHTILGTYLLETFAFLKFECYWASWILSGTPHLGNIPHLVRQGDPLFALELELKSPKEGS